MFLSAVENAVPPLNPQLIIAVGVLIIAALAVYVRYFQRIAVEGPKTRPDLLAMPEMLTGALVLAMYVFPAIVRIVGVRPEAAPALDPIPANEALIMALLPIAAIFVMVIARGGKLQNVFGFGKVGIIRAIGLGFCLAILALPLTYVAKAITVSLTASQEAPQALVQHFSTAVKGHDARIIWVIALSAVVIAPLTEEVIFRGMLYPMLARGFGRGPAALAAALIFAFVHDTYTDAPGLTVLALCFTLAYEVSGSLLVPIFMHATFNGVSLVVMWWQVHAGVGP